MPQSYSDNALLAKVRALYGKRLSENDYAQLMQKKSVGEVAAYLKKETYYAENLQEVKEDLIHREQLENFVHRRSLNTYLRLMKYAFGDSLFLTLYVMESEIEQLLTAIRLLNSQSIQRYIISLPVYLAKLMSFDLFAMADITSFDGLLTLLEHSEYYQILGKFRPTSSNKLIDITLCESALLSHYYNQAIKLTQKQYKGDAREHLLTLLYFKASIHNVSVILRMKRYLHSKAEMIRPRVVRVVGDRYDAFYERMLGEENVHSMQEILRHHGPLHLRVLQGSSSSMNLASQEDSIRKQFYQKLFRFSAKPVVSVICYMALLDIEINNITTIAEGIRYGLPPLEIKGLLVV